MDWLAVEKRHDSGVYAKSEFVITRGEGAYVWDTEGNRYLDLINGIGVGFLGHGHPKVVEAVRAQAEQLMVLPQVFASDRRAEFYKALTDVLPEPLTRVFPTNSGTEAVEAALKFARAATGRKKFVAAMRSFHGRSFGSLSVTWEKKYREPFKPLVEPVVFIPYNDVEALEAAVDEETAALILEPVQGEGGVRPATQAFLETARKRTEEVGALLILDEIQTGLGRTGKLFAFEHYGVTPDVLTLAKPLGGGFPLGAMVTTDAVADRMPKGAHGSTFGGNPLAMATGTAAIRAVVEERLWERAERLGRVFMEALRAIESKKIREVRGLGLMVGVELKEKAAPYLKRLAEEHKILSIQAGPNVMRFLPPVVVTEEELLGAARAAPKSSSSVTTTGGRNRITFGPAWIERILCSSARRFR